MECLEQKVEKTTIDGVLLQPLAIVDTEGGPVLHLLRKEYALMPYHHGFGELYCSEVRPGAVKAWKRHRRQTQLFAVPSGLMRLVLYDDRPHSPSEGTVLPLLLGRPDHYALLKIPQGIWYGFAAVGTTPALLLNCADIPHDPEESERLPLTNSRIPYSFSALV